jgi:hypothetical protein
MNAIQRRNAVATTSNGLPTVADWLTRIESLNDAALTDAVRGIWCGRDGREVLNVDSRSSLVVGWYSGRVEFAYLS